LFTDFDVQATWFVLGHLMLDHCAAEGGKKHPEIVRPSHSWQRQDWFEHDPEGGEDGRSIFLGRSLIEKIRACPVPQEIGCHSFSHVIFGDSGCSAETAESEILASLAAARNLGVEMESFAFPRNEIGHLDLLRKHGFTCYRGPEPRWYERESLPMVLRRVARMMGVLAAAEPPVALPHQTESGLWNIPGSMIYFPMHGLRKHIPVSFRVRRAIKGLDAAARLNKIFHLWFHPTNLSDATDKMFAGLRDILEHARSLRSRDELSILPMRSLVPASEARVVR
jgi:peptidoglycan/xylan/chitin deacetylase (PgdA/CDA1 family)